MTATKTPAKLTAAQRKEQQKLAEDRQARHDATAWVEAHHPDDVRFFAIKAGMGVKGEPWRALKHSWPELIAGLVAKGRAYAVAFIDEVRARQLWIDRSWQYATFAEGVTDGRRWASTIAPTDQLERLRSALRYSGRRILVDTEFKDAELSAAHGLLTWILGQDTYPRDVTTDEDGCEVPEFDSGCDEFKSFWQPFFQEPLDEVLDCLKVEHTDAKCKLLEPNYILGFIDGATGLSERLRADHLA